jgi:hypothetical protein
MESQGPGGTQFIQQSLFFKEIVVEGANLANITNKNYNDILLLSGIGVASLEDALPSASHFLRRGQVRTTPITTINISKNRSVNNQIISIGSIKSRTKIALISCMHLFTG